MSLAVWLPLTGNLNNQGLDSLSQANKASNSEFVNNGKIGKCLFHKTGSSSIANFASLNGATKWSISLWHKIPIETQSSAGNYNYFFSVGATVDGINGKIRVEHTGTRPNIQSLVPRNANSGFSTGYVGHQGYNTNNEWTHEVLTFDGENLKIYYNGELGYTLNKSNIYTSSFYLNGNVIIGDGTSYCYLNDFRVYDHCLSYKEIKEISKGLVLHYKLSGVGQDNLITMDKNDWFIYGWVGKDRLIQEEKNQFLIKNGNGWCDLLYDCNFLVNKTFTISCDVLLESTHNVSDSAGLFFTFDRRTHSTNTGSRYENSRNIITETDKWIHVKSTFTSLQSATPYVGFYMRGVTSDATTNSCYVHIRNIKIEEGIKETPWIPSIYDSNYIKLGFDDKIEYDCSGYKNNGIYNYQYSNLLTNDPNIASNWVQENHTCANFSDLQFSGIKVYSTVANGRVYNKVTNVWLTSGTTYVVSFYAKADVDGTTIDFSRNIADFTPKITLSTEWKYYQANITIGGTSTAGTLSMRINQQGRNVWLSGVRLETGTIASSKKIIDSDTPRYTTSYKFIDDCSQYIYTDSLQFLGESGFTFSCWAKQIDKNCTNGENTSNVQFIISQGRDYFSATEVQSYGANIRAVKGEICAVIGKTLMNSGIIFDQQNWYHIALVYDGVDAKLYVNGELKKTSAVSSSDILWTNNSGRKLVIGKMSHGYTSNSMYFPFVGNISDTRVYATALSSDDVLELYNTSALITNNGIAMAYEFEEN